MLNNLDLILKYKKKHPVGFVLYISTNRSCKNRDINQYKTVSQYKYKMGSLVKSQTEKAEKHRMD